jgi:hypothetical protein
LTALTSAVMDAITEIAISAIEARDGGETEDPVVTQLDKEYSSTTAEYYNRPMPPDDFVVPPADPAKGLPAFRDVDNP